MAGILPGKVATDRPHGRMSGAAVRERGHRGIVWALLFVVAALADACGARSALPRPSQGAGASGAGRPGASTCSARAWPSPLGIVRAISHALVKCGDPVSAPPCSGRCGNGVVDACAHNAQEDCDGSVVPATCAGLGYPGGGSLACRGCRFDRSGCDDVSGPSALVAHRSISDPGVAGLSIAVRSGRVALATFELGASGAGVAAHVTWMDAADLSPVAGPLRCLPVALPRGIDIAPLPGGWLVAVDTNDGNDDAIDLFALDGQGRPRSALELAGASDAVLAARPGAGPLLAFRMGMEQWAALLGADGRPVWATRVFASASTLAAYVHDATFVGDAFLLATPLEVDGVYEGVSVARIELDGRVTCVTRLGADTGIPALAWDGTRGGLTWSQSVPSPGWGPLDLHHAFVDASGAPGASLSLGAVHYGPAPVLPGGAGSLVLVGRFGPSASWHGDDTRELALARIDGTNSSASTSVLVENPALVFAYRLTAVGDRHAIAAWARDPAPPYGAGDAVEVGLVER